MTTRTERIPFSGLATIAFLLMCICLAGMVANAETTASSTTTLGDTELENVAIQPIDVVFVLDNSGSMRTNDPDFLTRTAVVNFATALEKDPGLDGRIAVVLFDGKARLIRSLVPKRPDQPNDTKTLLLDALAQLDFSGQQTNSPAGIERALYEFRQHGRPDARQAIVLLTDGKIDTGTAQNDVEAARWLREDLAQESRASGIRIFGVAFTDAADYQLMQALARRTNARYYRAFDASELSSTIDDVLSKIAREDFYGDDSADAAVLDPEPATTAQPDVAAAPLVQRDRTNFGLFGLLPVAVFLAAGSLFWRSRIRSERARNSTPPRPKEVHAPAAQLLDVGGHLGEAGVRSISRAAARGSDARHITTSSSTTKPSRANTPSSRSVAIASGSRIYAVRMARDSARSVWHPTNPSNSKAGIISAWPTSI